MQPWQRQEDRRLTAAKVTQARDCLDGPRRFGAVWQTVRVHALASRDTQRGGGLGIQVRLFWPKLVDIQRGPVVVDGPQGERVLARHAEEVDLGGE